MTTPTAKGFAIKSGITTRGVAGSATGTAEFGIVQPLNNDTLTIGDFTTHPALANAPTAGGYDLPAERFSYSGEFPTLGEAEEFLISEALSLSDGNQTAAARLLGISQSTLSRRLARDK